MVGVVGTKGDRRDGHLRVRRRYLERGGDIQTGTGRKRDQRGKKNRTGPDRTDSDRTGSVRVAGWFGPVRFGPVRFGSVRFGPVRFGTVRTVPVRFGTDRTETDWSGSERSGAGRPGVFEWCGAVRCPPPLSYYPAPSCYTTGVDRRVRGTAGGDRLLIIPALPPPKSPVRDLV